MILKYFVFMVVSALELQASNQYGQPATCTKVIEKTKMDNNGGIVKYTETISKCCDGLLRVNDVCRPYCKNCECIKSNLCQCRPLYKWNETSLHCEPMCECNNGYCLKPYQCTCHEGYEKAAGNYADCNPVCNPACPKSSTCKKPQQCECSLGYDLNHDTNECEPMCNENTSIFDSVINQCVLINCSCADGNGYCMDNYNKCVCYKGYQKLEGNTCQPMCQPKCENANCIAPNQCDCWPGFHVTDNPHVCESNDMCRKKPCINGECLQTGECKCKKGFRKSFSYTGQILCETVTIFIGKLMSVILGIPLILSGIVVFIVYVKARKKYAVSTNNPTVVYNNYGEETGDGGGIRVLYNR